MLNKGYLEKNYITIDNIRNRENIKSNSKRYWIKNYIKKLGDK